jgi:hypothetical protein
MRRREPRTTTGLAGLERNHVLALAALVVALVILVAFQSWVQFRPRSPEEQQAAAVDLARFSVMLHRRGCALGCPEYAVLADGQGRLRYEGVAGVAVVDEAVVELDPDIARALAVEVFRARFADQPDEWVPGGARCTAWRHGAEILRFGVTLDGRTRTLDYYAGCDPTNPELDALAQRIDELLDTRRWTLAATR